MGDKEIEHLRKGLRMSPTNKTPKKSDLFNKQNEVKTLFDSNANANANNNQQNDQKALEAEYMSSEKKNIFYVSYKNIQERFQYREQRINKIQMFAERVQKKLSLPAINNSKRTNK